MPDNESAAFRAEYLARRTEQWKRWLTTPPTSPREIREEQTRLYAESRLGLIDTDDASKYGNLLALTMRAHDVETAERLAEVQRQIDQLAERQAGLRRAG